jgi:hypothetical protein
MTSSTFKRRALNAIVKHGADFKSVFIDYDYMVYSEAFKMQPYYIISANEGNYKHLTGVVSSVSPYEFFSKCLNETLLEADFDFILTHFDGKKENVKNTIKKKIKALPYIADFFHANIVAEENFTRGRVNCVIATSDNKITIGFEDRKSAKPKTLLRGNEIKNAVPVSLVLRRNRGLDKFNTIIQGDVQNFHALFPEMVNIRV